MVLFSKGKCLVMDESGKKLISSVRTLDNCYDLVLVGPIRSRSSSSNGLDVADV